MRVLLDTHAFLWLDAAPDKLSATAAQIFQNPDNEIYLSIANIWEIQIKAQLGRGITLRLPLPELVRTQLAANGVRLLPLAPEHVYALQNLPPLHGDPFDRVLMAQAQVEGLTLMSNDGVLKDYGVSLIW
jgi:PIN domain nuclease of toxin-antitoxin system